MKFLKILQDYNKAIIKENQKLKSIYDALLKESEDDVIATEAEEDIQAAVNDDGQTTTTDEADVDEMMSAKEFFEEADVEKKENECDISEKDGEDQSMSPEEFFKPITKEDDVDEGVITGAGGAALGALAGGPVGAALGGAVGAALEGEKKNDDETISEDEMEDAQRFFADTNETDASATNNPKMSAEEFFDFNEDDVEEAATNSASKGNGDETNSASKGNGNEELMDAAEFFGGIQEKECPKCGKDPCECPTNEKEEADEDPSKKEMNEVEGEKKEEDNGNGNETSKSEKSDDEALEESLKEYRKNNAHLFVD